MCSCSLPCQYLRLPEQLLFPTVVPELHLTDRLRGDLPSPLLRVSALPWVRKTALKWWGSPEYLRGGRKTLESPCLDHYGCCHATTYPRPHSTGLCFNTSVMAPNEVSPSHLTELSLALSQLPGAVQTVTWPGPKPAAA